MLSAVEESLMCVKFLKLSFIIITVKADFYHENFPADVIEDADLDTPGLLKKYKYPVEAHVATTEDGYLLKIHRIPRPQGRPVFLMHGLLDSSATWVIMGPWAGLGYYLYDEGFDVWMGNARGNIYSRDHTVLDPNSNEKFWKFSFHEVGIYDLPAMIDYVLKYTKYEKLTYVGHSQGTTSFFILCSMRPAYNKKIIRMHALSPVAFMKHLGTPMLPLARSLLNIFDGVLNEIPPLTELVKNLCLNSIIIFRTCIVVLDLIMGETKTMNSTMWPVALGHLPAGAALRQVKHYIQLVDSGRFRAFDFGAADNLKRYGEATPPDYNLKNISAPLALYYSQSDFLSSDIDVKHLSSVLTADVAELYLFKKWSHLSYIWAIDARKLLYRKIIQSMKIVKDTSLL